MQTSQLRFFSLGVVTKHKERNSSLIQVFPYELFPLYDGALKSDTQKLTSKMVDATGKSYEVAVKYGNDIEAEWINWAGTNRETAPDVRIGERVVIIQYSDKDKYWWFTLGKEDGYRRLETARWLWSAHTRKDEKKLNKSNSYWLELSTHDKHVIFQTVMQNGEPYMYLFKVDTKDGKIVIEDNEGTRLSLVSKNKQIRLENSTGTYMEIVKDVINIKATKEINVEAPTINVKSDTTNTETKTHNEKVKTSNLTWDTVNQTSKTVTIKSGNMSITSTVDITGATTIKGSTALQGPLSVTGGSGGGGGSASIQGSLAITGGSLTHNGKTVGDDHVHKAQGATANTTPPQ
jgi:hypothetical protein